MYTSGELPSLGGKASKRSISQRAISTRSIRSFDEDVIRVYFTDGAFKSLKITRNTTADEVCLMFSRKIRLERFKKKFQLKEKTPTTERTIDFGEKVWDIKKEWERTGFTVSLDEKWKFIFTFTEEASRSLARRTLQLHTERASVSLGQAAQFQLPAATPHPLSPRQGPLSPRAPQPGAPSQPPPNTPSHRPTPPKPAPYKRPTLAPLPPQLQAQAPAQAQQDQSSPQPTPANGVVTSDSGGPPTASVRFKPPTPAQRLAQRAGSVHSRQNRPATDYGKPTIDPSGPPPVSDDPPMSIHSRHNRPATAYSKQTVDPSGPPPASDDPPVSIHSRQNRLATTSGAPPAFKEAPASIHSRQNRPATAYGKPTIDPSGPPPASDEPPAGIHSRRNFPLPPPPANASTNGKAPVAPSPRRNLPPVPAKPSDSTPIPSSSQPAQPDLSTSPPSVLSSQKPQPPRPARGPLPKPPPAPNLEEPIADLLAPPNWNLPSNPQDNNDSPTPDPLSDFPAPPNWDLPSNPQGNNDPSVPDPLSDFPAPPNWDLPSQPDTNDNSGPPGPAPPPDLSLLEPAPPPPLNEYSFDDVDGGLLDDDMVPPPPPTEGTDDELADLLVNADWQRRQSAYGTQMGSFNLDSALSALAEASYS